MNGTQYLEIFLSLGEKHGDAIGFLLKHLTNRETLDVLPAQEMNCSPLAQVAILNHIPSRFHECRFAAARIAGLEATQ